MHARPGRQSSRAETEAVVCEAVQSAEDVVVHLAEDVVRAAARVVDRDAGAASDRGFRCTLRVMWARQQGGVVPVVESRHMG